jgi:predicted NUDIX family phosphoesterase
MKHPQHILAFDKKAFGIDGLEGLIKLPAKAFFEAAGNSLFIGRREELEKDERFGQALPYIVLYRKASALQTSPRVFVYQRTKKVGEERLAGNLSIGTGGHMDLADVVMGSNSIIDILATFARGIARELNEEIAFKHAESLNSLSFDQVRSAHPECFPKFVGMINDTSNAVGRVHYGCVFALEVPEKYVPLCKEEELTTIGMALPSEVLARGEGALENWSQLLLSDFGFITE